VIFAAAAAAAPDCRTPFTNEDLRIRIEAASNAVVTSETEIARKLVARTSDDLGCLEGVVARAPLGELAWLRAWLAWHPAAGGARDEGAAAGWVRLARAVGGDEVPDFVPAQHPFRAVASEPAASPEGAGRPLAPKGGAVFLDGAFLAVAQGHPGAPGLLQVADETGRVTRTEWLADGVLPAELVGPPGGALKPPRWWTGAPPEGAVAVAEPRGGGASLPLGRVLAAGGLALAAGGAYGLAAASQGGLDAATSEAELAGARTRVNVLAVGSAALAAGAVGVGVTVWLADGGGVGLSLPF
jgi:hypothetical protein